MKIPYFIIRSSELLPNFTKFIFLLSLLLTSFTISAQQPAFPSATGAAAYVTGGRGMPVFKVTNLNATGTGSLDQAINDAKNNGGGIVVFTVSGTIRLPNVMSHSDVSNITIAGQSAPAGGITITGNKADFKRWNNFIIRYIRFRPEYNIPTNIVDGARFYDCINGIVDHCSFSWGKDEVVSSTGYNSTHTITWQRNLIAEGKTGSLFGDSDNQDGSYDLSFHNNAYYNITHRFPNINASGRADHINNVIFNWKFRLSYFGGDIELNSINNYYIRGCHAANLNDNNKVPYRDGWTPEIYIAGNHVTDVLEDPNADNWGMMDWFLDVNSGPYAGTNGNDPLTRDYQVNNMFPLLGIPTTILSAEDALVDVTTDVGTNAYVDENGNRVDNSDSLDIMYLTNMIAGDCIPYESSSSYQDYPENQHYIDFHNNVSSTPWATGYQDTNDDGIPDAWITAQGFGINDDMTTHVWPSGYVGIEEYLNLVDGPSLPPVIVTGVSVSPPTATINIPQTVTLSKTIQPANATNQTGIWSSNDTSVATVDNNGLVTPVAEGVTTVKFTTNDGAFSDFATITVTAIPIPVESVSVSPQTLNVGLFTNPVLTATILPISATNQTGTWTSSDVNVATIDQTGTISPVAVGVTTMTFTTNDGGLSDSAEITVNNDNFGTYELYNADTDQLIQIVSGGEVFDLNAVGDKLNFRVIPQGGDTNAAVESVETQWTGVETGEWLENAPLYAGMTNHTGMDFAPYSILEGTYNFLVTYHSADGAGGTVVATDSFTLTFSRGIEVFAGEDQDICEGTETTLTATGAETYVWSTGETTATINVSPSVTTTYTVTGTDPDGSTASDSVTVTVNQIPTVDAGADENICPGESVTLTATGSGGNYEWSNGATTQSITVSPNNDRTYIVTVTQNGCSSTDSVRVFVSPGPTANAGTDVTIVGGSSATLTATGGGTYLWSTGETTPSITVSPAETTIYSVEVTNDNGCSDTDEVTVNIEAQAVANAGEDVAICQGESVTLTASGGTSYQWSTGQTTQSITITPLNTTIYTVTVSNASSSDTDDVTVTVNPLPNVNAGEDVTISAGESVTLSATGGNTYLWSTGDTSANISVSPTQTTTYSVTTTINGCSDTDEVTVTIENSVVADAGEDTEICYGENTELTANGGDTYLWSTGETTQSITVSPEATTTYTVTVSNTYASDSDEVTVTIQECAGLDDADDTFNDFSFTVYPNPTSGRFTVRVTALLNISSISIFDMLGKQVHRETIDGNDGQPIYIDIDISGMSKGFYLVNLSGKDANVTKKLILQ